MVSTQCLQIITDLVMAVRILDKDITQVVDITQVHRSDYSARQIGSYLPSQNTLILLNKNLKIYKSLLDKEVHIGQKAYDFPKVSQAAFENYCTILPYIASYFFLQNAIHLLLKNMNGMVDLSV